MKSHEKGETHKENMKLRSKQVSCDVFFVKQEGTIVKTVNSKTDINNNSPSVSNQEGTDAESVQIEDNQIPGSSQPSAAVSNLLTSIDKIVTKNDMLKAEVLWVLHTVCTHQSFNSNKNITNLFQVMFHDSFWAS